MAHASKNPALFAEFADEFATGCGLAAPLTFVRLDDGLAVEAGALAGATV
jgi:hypothetical protein